jgi:hypothetical protein
MFRTPTEHAKLGLGLENILQKEVPSLSEQMHGSPPCSAATPAPLLQ